MYEKFKETMESHSDLQKYIFIRGFLFSDRENLDLSQFPFYGNWNCKKIGNKYYGYVHNKQNIYSVDYGSSTFFLFGHAYNPFTMEINEIKILEKNSQKLWY